MSLVFENAITEFEVSDADLLEPTERATVENESEFDVPLRTVTEYATSHRNLDHPERSDWTCIPLHGVDTPELTGEYVGFLDHSVRGAIFVYRLEGDHSTITLEDAASSVLGKRMRFWHSDFVPDEDPSYYSSPVRAIEPPRNPIENQSVEAFFDDLRAYIEAERIEQSENSRQYAQTQSPRTILQKGGDAIPSIGCVGEASDNVYRFRVDSDLLASDGESPTGDSSVQTEFGVYEGNQVLILPPESADSRSYDAFPLDGHVTDITGCNVYLRVDWKDVTKRTAGHRLLDQSDSEFGIVSILNRVPFDREEKAVDVLRSKSNFRDILTGQADLTFGDESAAKSSLHDDELNQEQKIAVEHALLADDLFCIQGPPGTGKTRTLIEAIRRMVEAGQSVLVCADSNQAVDNLVVGSSTSETVDDRSLHAYGQHGSEELVLCRLNSQRSRRAIIEKQYNTRNTGTADVVAATNSSAAVIDREFDAVVIDEATQATCTATAIPLSKANKALLAGDHKQLPPFSSTEEPPESAYGLSLFEHLYADGGIYEGIGIQLRTQYRMHNQISYFPNRRFYDRVLRNGREVQKLPNEPPIVGYDIGGKEVEVGNSKANPEEARLVTYLVENIVTTTPDLMPSDVGVITPYRAQVDMVVEGFEKKPSEYEQVRVDTIDSFQGSEKEVILVSMVRSNQEGRIGFMGRRVDGPRRLNVAITRGERYCGVIGNWKTFVAPSDAEKCDELYKDLYSYLSDTGRLNHVDPDLIPRGG